MLNKELQQFFNSIDATVWTNDVVNKRIYVSKGIETLLGYTVEQFYEDYSFWTSTLHEEDRKAGLEFYETVMSGEIANTEVRFVTTNGIPIWVYMSGTPIFDKNNDKVEKINGFIVDISERKQTEDLLQESENRFRSVVELSPNMIMIHQDEKIVYANPTTVRLAGVNDSSQLIGRSIYDFIHPSDREKAIARNEKIQQGMGENTFIEYKLVRPDGKIIHLEMVGKQFSYQGASATLVVGNDVTSKKEYEQKIKYMAYHDSLTDLPNRYMYSEKLEEAVEHCQKCNQTLAVLFIDLDRFKFINDTMGHEAGDTLLKQVAHRLTNCVRERDLVARLGGDEFAILLEKIDENHVRNVSQRILQAFSTPFMINNKNFYTTPSIGISLCPRDGQKKELLNSKADRAMYLAKKNGKNTYQFYMEDNEEVLERKIRIEQDIRKAIENNEFYLVYQPKLHIDTGEIYGVEALVRWKHPELGLISPVEFIPIVEESGLIVSLGKWILDEACRQNKLWKDCGIHIKMAVNVSALQFEDRRFVDIVNQTLFKHRLPPHYLGLEITESVMQNISKSTAIIHDLKTLGVKISIDDFGTGYSSLSVLSNLPIDNVKIDKSFVNEITTRRTTASLIKTMIEMGEHLEFNLIAEGIEKKEQVDFLINNGCRLGQGYYYSPPLPAAEVENLLKKKWINKISH
ncbi:EAL domain-containing protein [Anaerobacillus sp. MEB173]|uniref:bifunctional diguanylate cyclase/phosphodiesterase n=1 Tax=Anaerobacillus sp. MEB173 TaxID=3383345 RepID=UPI003F8FFE7E